MADLAERLTNAEREQRWKNQRPKDAATVIMLDRSENEPRVLMGRRHDRHVFLPGMYVFPGGRVDRTDGYIPAAAELQPAVQTRLLGEMKQGKGAHRARALGHARAGRALVGQDAHQREERAQVSARRRRADARPSRSSQRWGPQRP